MMQPVGVLLPLRANRLRGIAAGRARNPVPALGSCRAI
jgi:hypothetical protein